MSIRPSAATNVELAVPVVSSTHKSLSANLWLESNKVSGELTRRRLNASVFVAAKSTVLPLEDMLTSSG
jgi:hypothetical protein